MRPRPDDSTPSVHPWWASPQSHLLIALVAFASGMLVMWLIVQAARQGGAPQQVLTIPSAPPLAAETGLPVPQDQPAAAPPSAPPDAHHHASAQKQEGGTSAAQAAVLEGNALYDQRRWVEAIARYEFAIANGIDNPNVRTDLGNCFRFVGLSEKALEQYGVAQEQAPMHEYSLFNTATLYSEVLRDMPKAVATWRVYEQRFPASIESDRVKRFLAQNPAFAAALRGEESTPPPATPAGTPSGATSPVNQQLRDWMLNEQALPTP